MTYKKTSTCILFSAAAFVLLCGWQSVFAQQVAANDKKVKVLVVTGIEYHNWRETAPQVAKQLASCPDLEVLLEPDYNILCTNKIFDYDVIFFNFCNLVEYDETRDDDLAIANIEKFLKSGKSIVLLHLAIGMFEKRTDRVLPLIGRNYDRALPPHDPFRNFKVTIIDKEHPITKHVPDFTIDDELYTCMGGDLPIHVLAEAFSPEQQKSYPMAYLYKYGDGYAFTTVLGHDLLAFQSQGFVTMLRNAVLWLGKKEVPAEPATVVAPGRRIPTGRVYPPDEVSNRERMGRIEKSLAANEKLLLYLDCGREWDKIAATGETFSVDADCHRFPGAQDSWVNDTPNQEHIAFGNPAVIHLDKLNLDKKYRVYFSWWDHNAAGRVQTVSLHSKDKARNEIVVKETRLPNFTRDEQPPETKSFDIDAAFVKDGGCVCTIDLIRGPNAVICEIWLVEVK
ncbi:MAG: ThuA domain-containing protein [Planctomycetaceae bacterium]|nr:ThuA domain-containing protein [Planctomycetaceae bacterium]